MNNEQRRQLRFRAAPEIASVQFVRPIEDGDPLAPVRLRLSRVPGDATLLSEEEITSHRVDGRVLRAKTIELGDDDIAWLIMALTKMRGEIERERRSHLRSVAP